MKRILLSFFILVFAIALCILPNTNNVYAATATTPTYNESFNKGIGAFYANGTPVTIYDNAGTTTVYWVGGKQEIKNTALIFGGGVEGTSYDTASIIMEGGTVGSIYAGGYSIQPENPAIVNKSEIVVNGGTVTNSVISGGLLYSQVDNAVVTINGGEATFVTGGGIASYSVDGTPYNTGTEADPQASGTIVRNSDITINNGTLSDVYGGGQGYSNTEAVTVNVKGGTMDYLTAGGSNGYTGSANINIDGGSVNVYQSANRGTVNNVNLKMTNGTVTDMYVGGENAYDVTGVLNNIKAELLGGSITNLNPGLSGGVPLNVDGKVYFVEYNKGVIQNNNVPNSQEIDINPETNVLIMLAIIAGSILAVIAFILLVLYVS